MNAELHHDILRQLAEFEFRQEGSWLRKGRCPACGKREFHANAEKPLLLRCGRLGQCGHEATAKELYPERFEDWSKRPQEAARTQLDTRNINSGQDGRTVWRWLFSRPSAGR